MYQVIPDSLYPIIPRGTIFSKPKMNPKLPNGVDSAYLKIPQKVEVVERYRPNPSNGSNNWVVGGSKTKSGAPILTNDPHLELSLPSIWYELQLTDAQSTAYGVSLPGVPFVIIGFTNEIAWGITNSQRDVKDYYAIRFQDASKKTYWYNKEWKEATIRIEEIKVKGTTSVYDTVAYTVFGPVMYDASFRSSDTTQQALAVRWIAHDASNEGLTFYKLNRAKNYSDYVKAIRTFDCPGQNFIFASKSGDIALWQQGKFPARWPQQGLFVMPGESDAYNWQGYIPQDENPHIVNPARGFIESANQRPVDHTYPYFIPGTYITARGASIEKKLAHMSQITPEDMRLLLTDYDNVPARQVRRSFIRYTREKELTPEEANYFEKFRNWDLQASPTSVGQTIYQVWMDSLKVTVWGDEIGQTQPKAPMPDEQVLIELLIKDTTSVFYDDRRTSNIESLSDVMTASFKKAVVRLQEAEKVNELEWSRFKKPSIYHLLKDAVPTFGHKNLPLGGHGTTINAITHNHGPSWRMVVHMTNEVEAYGAYPAGQSGNPGSPYYDNFVSTWVKGELYPLWVMKRNDVQSERIKWHLTFQPNIQ